MYIKQKRPGRVKEKEKEDDMAEAIVSLPNKS